MIAMMKNHPRTSLLLAIALLSPLGAWAQFRHPRYLHARTDLRRATILMRLPDEPNVMRDMRIAAEQTDRAIHELDMAARFDLRDIDEHPPVDVRMGRGARMRRTPSDRSAHMLRAVRDLVRREAVVAAVPRQEGHPAAAATSPTSTASLGSSYGVSTFTSSASVRNS